MTHVRNKRFKNTGLRAVLGYAAVHFNRVHVDRTLLLKALALYTLVNAATNLITRRGFGEKVRHVLHNLPPVPCPSVAMSPSLCCAACFL